MRNLQLPGRSPTRSLRGMVSTSHTLASQTGLDILKRGGNAMDAAIAAAAVLAVVEPQATGIGGDCFVLFSPANSGEVLAFNGSGRAPAAASIEALRAEGLTTIPPHSAHAVTVPGAIDAWCRLNAEHGRLPFADLLQDAIYYAENGFVVTDRAAADWKRNAPWLAQSDIADTMLKADGTPFGVGDIFRNPALGKTLRHIAEHGRAGFYEGPVAEEMVTYLQKLGGKHTLEDFAKCQGEYVTPIYTDYHGYRLYQVPPNNQGLTALLMLNALAGFDLSQMRIDDPAYLHLEIEAARLAYQERDRRIADPVFAKVPVKSLLSEEYAAHLRSQIDPTRSSRSLPEPHFEHSDTVYLSVVDEDRNTVSFINSIYTEFGSGIMPPESGVLLQNRGKSFRLDPAHPNSLAPGKRPMHTIMPGIVMKEGKIQASLGVMGGDYQPTGQVHVLTGIINFGLDPQEAMDAPRMLYQNGEVQVEDGVSAANREALSALGHTLVDAPAPLGGGQMIWIDWEQGENGALVGGSDPRKDGCALGY